MTQDDPGQGAIAARTRRRVTRRLLPFLFLLYFFAFTDRINVGVAKLGMQREFGFTDEVVGFGAGVFFAAARHQDSDQGEELN